MTKLVATKILTKQQDTLANHSNISLRRCQFFGVFFCVFERHPRAKSNEKTRQVNKVNNGGGGKEKREKPPAFNSLRFSKRPFHS